MPGSPWCAEAFRQGCAFVNSLDPFWWTANLDGIIGKNRDWEAAGAQLRWYVQAKLLVCGQDAHETVHLVAHSHGGAVCGYALAAEEPVTVQTLITVATPVRDDMQHVWELARRRVALWVHIYTDGDWWQWLGSRFDGSFRFQRTMPLADYNLFVSGESHGSLMTPTLWTDRAWWAWLQPESGQPAVPVLSS